MGDFSTVISHSEAETISLGIKLAENLPDEIIVPVTGSLGVGKSVLIRGIAKGLGYEGRVRSPSYTIERIYNTPRGELHYWEPTHNGLARLIILVPIMNTVLLGEEASHRHNVQDKDDYTVESSTSLTFKIFN